MQTGQSKVFISRNHFLFSELEKNKLKIKIKSMDNFVNLAIKTIFFCNIKAVNKEILL